MPNVHFVDGLLCRWADACWVSVSKRCRPLEIRRLREIERCCHEMAAGKLYRGRGGESRQDKAPAWFAKKNFGLLSPNWCHLQTKISLKDTILVEILQTFINQIWLPIWYVCCVILEYDILMYVNDGSVWFPIAWLKYKSMPGGSVTSVLHVASGLPSGASVGGIIQSNRRLSG